MSDSGKCNSTVPFPGGDRFAPPYLDYLMTTKECTSWLGKIAEETLSIRVNEGEIPAIDLNSRVRRFHPRSVLIAMGADPKSLLIREFDGFLEVMLTTDECADWFQLKVKTFRTFVHSRQVRALSTNPMFWRFNPRTVPHGLGVKNEALPPQMAPAA